MEAGESLVCKKRLQRSIVRIKLRSMSEEQFTNTLRELTQRKPFIPFVVEMLDGRRLIIDQPAVGFGGGVAGFISDEEGFVDFSCGEVRAMSHVTAEMKL